MIEMLKADMPPFELYKNVYYVGCKKVSVHIIDTGDGLIMIDTGYPDMFNAILGSMKELGLDPKNIKGIFHSHGHIDHYGCTQRFKELSGAKTYISKLDNEIVNGNRDLSWTRELRLEPIPSFNCDVLVDDGDVFTFGNTTVRCVLTPGHTEGVLSFFITIKGEEESIVCAMHGGVGLNTLSKDWLYANGFTLEMREVFKNSIKKVINEKVDLVLGNHPNQTNTEEKYKKVMANKSVIDSQEWKNFLLSKLTQLEEKEKDLSW